MCFSAINCLVAATIVETMALGLHFVDIDLHAVPISMKPRRESSAAVEENRSI